VFDELLLPADSSSIVHNLNTRIRLYRHSQFSITLLININYRSVSKTAETDASRPRPRPQNFGLERSRDEDRGLEDSEMTMGCGSRVSTRDPLTHDQVNKIPSTGYFVAVMMFDFESTST